MRTIQQLHEAALEIIADAPTRTLACVAGELAAVIDATAAIVAPLAESNAARKIHTRYSSSKNHNPNTKLTVGASQVLALTSLVDRT